MQTTPTILDERTMPATLRLGEMLPLGEAHPGVTVTQDGRADVTARRLRSSRLFPG